jgi:hypothetical protein
MVISLIESLGFPIIAFGVTIYVIIYLIKKEENRQLLNDKRYDELTNKFIGTITKISDENNKMLKDLSDSIRDVMNRSDEQKRDR